MTATPTRPPSTSITAPSTNAASSPTFASLHGGLLLTQTMQSITPLEAALDGALTALRASAA